jgi:phenylacetate-CoA ligase
LILSNMKVSADRNGKNGIQARSWSWMLRNIILPAGDVAFGQRMIQRLRFLKEAQWWDPAKLSALRNQSLKSLARIAYSEVPFYREIMDSAGVAPEDIQRPEDLRRLPIVTKSMFRAGYPHKTTRKTGQKTYESRSSGSTGENFAVIEDSETAGWYRASLLLALEWAGWNLGEPHLQTGMTLNRNLSRQLKDMLLRCHYVSAFDLSDSHLDECLDILDRNSIEHLWGYPGSLYFLARRASEKGWNRPLRSIVTWGDNLFPHYRKAIEQAFQRRVLDTYGCAEGMHIAAQCSEEDHYHVHTLDVVVEYLDDEDRPVPLSQPGNLIVTRLHPGPMPLIRYRVGDMAIAGLTRICKCGRGFDLLESIQGRDTDVVLTPSGNRLIVHYFTGVLEHFTEIQSFQVVQESLESIQLRIVATENLSNELRDRIISELKKKGAQDLEIHIEAVKEIPLPPSGKRRFVLSNLKPQT